MAEARLNETESEEMLAILREAKISLEAFVESRYRESSCELLPLFAESARFALPSVVASLGLTVSAPSRELSACIEAAVLVEAALRLEGDLLSPRAFTSLAKAGGEARKNASTLRLVAVARILDSAGSFGAAKFVDSLVNLSVVSEREARVSCRRKVDFLATLGFVERTLGSIFGTMASLPAVLKGSSARVSGAASECGRLFALLARLRADSAEAADFSEPVQVTNLFLAMLLARTSGYESSFVRRSLSTSEAQFSLKERSLLKLLLRKYKIEEEVLDVMEQYARRVAVVAEVFPDSPHKEGLLEMAREATRDLRSRKVNRLDIFGVSNRASSGRSGGRE
jgi:hypothetical protein